MGKIEQAITDNIAAHGDLDPGEVVVHFDLVVETRYVSVEGVERVNRRHWTPIGSDPHLSYGNLIAAAHKILHILT